jgi:hypothetical protein
MSEERTEEFSEPRLNIKLAVSDDKHSADTAPKDEGTRKEAAAPGTDKPREKPNAPKTKTVSIEKVRRQSRLPSLEDDGDIGVEKEHIVTRDGKADLLFAGTLLASAAPASAPKGTWQEYRIYQTHAGKHVFSKVTRHIYEEENDVFEAEVFDPTPSTVQSQLIRGARELARAKPLTWMDAAVSFFGYDPLAKVLYRKLDVRFEEQIG